MIRLATDVGGTFTDLVGYDERTGQLFTGKSLTTTEDQSVGVIDTIAAAESVDGLDVGAVTFFAHGGTTVINAITERKGVKTALVTTAGFRDVLEIGRGNRPDLYNLRSRSPVPIVPRHLRFEVRERLDAGGRVITPLALEDIGPIIAACREHAVEAIGVVFLHSYANPEHERRCAEALAAALPEVTVCASHEVSRQWREYERSNTVALNAYVHPIIRHYFSRLEAALAQKGVTCPYYAMQSNGGIATFEQASDRPLTLVESGPAGGVAGAARIGEALAESDVLYLDIGGTTAKCSLIREGRPTLNTEYKLEHTRIAPGYPVQVPVVDIVEIGSGGGSIAWIDGRGALRVGPESAGSMPGPACYGRGGSKPTVTDAILILGVFDPANFASGTMKLDPELAKAAIEPVARHLGLSTVEAALAIVDIAHANAINALKLVTVQRGHDPRDVALLVSGGAGPAMATRLGRELQAKCTIIPPHPGIFSAWGMLAAQPRVDFRTTWYAALAPGAIHSIEALFAGLEKDAIAHFGQGADADISFSYGLEARYRGQEHGVFAPYQRGDDVATFSERFSVAHERTYTFRLDSAEIEVTTMHLEARLGGTTIELAVLGTEGRALDAALRGHRDVYFGAALGWLKCPIYDRGLLPTDTALAGPLLIEEATATTLVLENQIATMTDTGIIVVREVLGDGA